MSRRRRYDPSISDRCVDDVLRAGYYVIELSPYHFRFQDAVDLWPTSAKWFDLKGYGSAKSRKGQGVPDLIAYLKEHYPLGFDIDP